MFELTSPIEMPGKKLLARPAELEDKPHEPDMPNRTAEKALQVDPVPAVVQFSTRPQTPPGGSSSGSSSSEGSSESADEEDSQSEDEEEDPPVESLYEINHRRTGSIGRKFSARDKEDLFLHSLEVDHFAPTKFLGGY